MSALAHRLARLFTSHDKVLFGDASAIPDLLIAGGKYITTPSADSPSFNHEMLKTGISNETDLIIPLRKAEINQLAGCKDLFEEYGIQLLVPSREFLKLLEFIINPSKELNPTILINGKMIDGKSVFAGLEKESGICIVSDSGNELFFCCLE